MSTLAATREAARRQLREHEARDGRPSLGRRAAAIVLAVALAALCAVAVLVAVDLVSPRAFGLDAGTLGLAGGGAWVRRLALGLGAAGLGTGALMLVARPPSIADTGQRQHILAVDERGTTSMPDESLCQLIAALARRRPGVIDARVSVRGMGLSPIAIRVTIVVLPGVPLASLSTALREELATTVSELTGLVVQAVHAKVLLATPRDLDRVLI